MGAGGDIIHPNDSATAILDRGGEYLLALKDNQSNLHDEVRRYLNDEAARIHDRFDTTDGDYGRVEVRRHRVSHDVDWLTGIDPVWWKP